MWSLYRVSHKFHVWRMCEKIYRMLGCAKYIYFHHCVAISGSFLCTCGIPVFTQCYRYPSPSSYKKGRAIQSVVNILAASVFHREWVTLLIHGSVYAVYLTHRTHVPYAQMWQMQLRPSYLFTVFQGAVVFLSGASDSDMCEIHEIFYEVTSEWRYPSVNVFHLQKYSIDFGYTKYCGGGSSLNCIKRVWFVILVLNSPM